MTVEHDIEAMDQFPVGMRVLAVDDDQTCLRILETLLHRCQYHVTTTDKAQTALELLRENKNKFDLVISDVDMPDMDGFKLLERVGLEMDSPVIMLSAHSDPKYVMKGVKHGACDYMLKPVRIEELKNIWQHVVRKSKFKKMKSIVTNGESEGNSDQNGVRANRKRKDQSEEEDEDEEEEEEQERGNEKKPRVIWTRELHNKFLAAVDHVGVKNAVPKKILELMNVDNLTRENVGSHLQKFRLALKKINNEANMAAANSHFTQMSSLKGLGSFHHYRPTPLGSSQFHGGAATMRHYPSNRTFAGMFPHFKSSLPRNHNDGGYMLQGKPFPSLETLHITNNNNNKAFPSFTSPQSSPLVASSNHLVLEGHQQSSFPSFSPHLEINKRLEDWSNAVYSNNIPQSNVHSKPDALEWNMDTTKTTSFCRDTDFGSSNAAQADFLDPFQMKQQHENILDPMTVAELSRSSSADEGLFMGQQKLENNFMASDAGSLDDIVNSMMTQV
ncbi:hypothetical protein Bca52824_092873 [Brassica carinata]|uniref:Two-component response regulator n=1 Tax=Brassica carinata TaxID=52824 RepID=A0A8X7P791_BRACI|nr:hypothetical protein Bca52824_092873 [Brassica carinata]